MAVAATRAVSKVMGLGLGARLGLPTSAAELSASLNTADYVYGTPSEAQLQRLLRQQMGGSPQGQPDGASKQPAAATKLTPAFGAQAALQGEMTATPEIGMAASAALAAAAALCVRRS